MSVKMPPELVSISLQQVQTGMKMIREDNMGRAGLEFQLALGNINKAVEIKNKLSGFTHEFVIDDEFRMALAQIGMQIRVIGESMKHLHKNDMASAKTTYQLMHDYFYALCAYFDVPCDMKNIMDEDA